MLFTPRIEASKARGDEISSQSLPGLILTIHQNENEKKILVPEESDCRFLTFGSLSRGGRDQTYNILALMAQLWVLKAPRLTVRGTVLKSVLSLPHTGNLATPRGQGPTASGYRSQLHKVIVRSSVWRIDPASNVLSENSGRSHTYSKHTYSFWIFTASQ